MKNYLLIVAVLIVLLMTGCYKQENIENSDIQQNPIIQQTEEVEVEVEEDEIRYAVSRSIDILKSIKYNELVIEKYINDNDLDSSETVYKIPEPKNKDESKNILQYIEEYEEGNE